MNVNDTAPTTANPDTLFIPYLWPDEPDPTNSLTYANNYLEDNPGTCLSATNQTQACKYVNPVKSGKSNYGPVGSSYMCSALASQTLQRLSSDTSTVTTKIKNLQQGGNTNLHTGFMWGWRTLSPKVPFADGTAYGTKTVQKVIVFMTDGANVWATAKGWGTSNYLALGYYKTAAQGRMPTKDVNGKALANPPTTQAEARLIVDELTLEACNNARAAGVDIYTIAFSVPADPIDAQGKQLLLSCAGKSGGAGGNTAMYFDASDSTTLQTAFNSIGTSLSKLRLTQ
jgi:hypothetical protein